MNWIEWNSLKIWSLNAKKFGGKDFFKLFNIVRIPYYRPCTKFKY